ncbi:hypothetical protein GW17_00050777 [Ensete ventricosum]|nr:hypothetical protein GW17_00050777 [Ensete ventricosum]
MIIVDRVGRHKLFIIGVLMFVTHLMVGGGVGGAARGSRRDKQRLHVHDLSVDMCVHRRLCVVLGAIGMAGLMRDTSTGDQIGRTKHGDSRGPFVGLHQTKGLPIEKMDQIWKEHWFWKKVEGVEKEGSVLSAVIESELCDNENQ